ncbi:hypothetical protein ABLO26_21260 [Neobacillus sp. 179-J 1A1 HS]|uniref:hypothetical protein n=1 Tax=Neobacillus driksii TaxID=3035913 RepID=UPI0035BC0B55
MNQPNKNPKHLFIGEWLFNEIDLIDKLFLISLLRKANIRPPSGPLTLLNYGHLHNLETGKRFGKSLMVC